MSLSNRSNGIFVYICSSCCLMKNRIIFTTTNINNKFGKSLKDSISWQLNVVRILPIDKEFSSLVNNIFPFFQCPQIIIINPSHFLVFHEVHALHFSVLCLFKKSLLQGTIISNVPEKPRWKTGACKFIYPGKLAKDGSTKVARKTGYLKKIQGGYSYHKYYFTLTKTRLLYFSKKKEHKLVGEISLPCGINTNNIDTNKNYAFELFPSKPSSQHEKSIFLAAESQEEVECVKASTTTCLLAWEDP
ncbi:hypothetical protein RFI_20599 [Reticulomyxa filosa]|uniref:PH domain-containing protein n=1 Tax=Reticulomyxa filosa TaxID=46433 RepID=X6MSU0_RETFI|nr:hypothetical protein RFI_20599 [Reticulomyxa filosa]|eukprot:ETO16741.1 hypothetical protein RFI_20599 [Reticulomyxa filosa]